MVCNLTLTVSLPSILHTTRGTDYTPTTCYIPDVVSFAMVPSGDAIHRRCKEDAKNTEGHTAFLVPSFAEGYWARMQYTGGVKKMQRTLRASSSSLHRSLHLLYTSGVLHPRPVPFGEEWDQVHCKKKDASAPSTLRRRMGPPKVQRSGRERNGLHSHRFRGAKRVLSVLCTTGLRHLFLKK